MNCKQGDLAIVVKSYAGNEGKIVRCVRGLGWANWTNPDGSYEKGFKWEIDLPLKGWNGVENKLMNDNLLRPIRPDDGQDETLSWAGLPNTIAETA